MIVRKQTFVYLLVAAYFTECVCMLALFIDDGHRSTAKSSATSPTRSLSSRVSASTTHQSDQRTPTHSNSNSHSFSRTRAKAKAKAKAMAIFPRSPNYERLEGGMGPIGPNSKSHWKWTWRKFAVGTAVLVILWWLYKIYPYNAVPHPGEQWGLPVKGGDYR